MQFKGFRIIFQRYVYFLNRSQLMAELLNPHWSDLCQVIPSEFQGMPVQPLTAEGLRVAGEQLISRLREEITREERRFIISVKEIWV